MLNGPCRLVAADTMRAVAQRNVVAGGSFVVVPPTIGVAAPANDGFHAAGPLLIGKIHFGRTIAQRQTAATPGRRVWQRTVHQHIGMQRYLSCLEAIKDWVSRPIRAYGFKVQHCIAAALADSQTSAPVSASSTPRPGARHGALSQKSRQRFQSTRTYNKHVERLSLAERRT